VTLKLVMIRCPDNVAPERREVRGGEFSIGRGRDNEWVIADPERHLSKRHCRLVYSVGDWELHDLSANGTFLNGASDPLGQGSAEKLRNGDRIREKLLGLSDYDMFCTYSILESPMGVENYVATLRLTPVTDGDQTFLEWTAEFDCAPEREAELVNNIGGGVFQGGFDALKRAFGG